MLVSKILKLFKLLFKSSYEKKYFDNLVQLMTIFYKSRSCMIYVVD